MEIFFSILESVGVLLGLGMLGFYMIARRMMPGDLLGFLSPLVLEIALPSLIFVSIVKNFTFGDFPGWWTIPLWWIFFTVVAIILTWLVILAVKPDNPREFAISLFYQNGIFFPLAIITGLYGHDSFHLVTLFLFISFHPALFFSTYRFFFKGSQQSKLDWKKIIHPVLIMTLMALAVRLTGVHDLVPDFLISELSILGAMALPLVMIILGGNIFVDFQKKGRFETVEIIKFVAVKNFVFPFVFLLILLMLKPPYHIALIIFLQSAVPPITAIPIVTERLGGNSSLTNQFIVSSYLTLLISVPVMFSIFARYFAA